MALGSNPPVVYVVCEDCQGLALGNIAPRQKASFRVLGCRIFLNAIFI